jgi:hypothetical protein
LDKIRVYEEQLSSQSIGDSHSSLPSPNEGEVTTGRQSLQGGSPTPADNAPNNLAEGDLSYADDDSAISPGTLISLYYRSSMEANISRSNGPSFRACVRVSSQISS